MFEWEYIRVMNRNYLKTLSQKQQTEESFQYRMLTSEPIRGLLSAKVRNFDGAVCLLYDISSKISINGIYGEKKINLEELHRFFFFLKHTIKNMEAYFLTADNLVLLPDFIFQEPDTKEFFFLYYPDSGIEEGENLEQLYTFLLSILDHEDEALTECFYGLYEHLEDLSGIFWVEEIYKNLDRLRNERQENMKDPFPEKNTDECEALFEPIDSVPNFEEKQTFSLEQKGELKEKCKRAFLMCIIYACAMGGCVYFIYSRYFFSILENVIFLGGIATLTLVLAIGMFFWLRQKETSEKTPHEGMKDVYENDFESYRVEENAFGDAMYGKTIYIEAAEVENKLYGIGKENRNILEMTKYPFTLGKKEGAVDAVLSDESVSRIHARFLQMDKELFLEDLNSTNGTYKNGILLAPREKVRVEPEDQLQFGKLKFLFR